MKALELKVPPVLLFALVAAAMYGLAWVLPAWTVSVPGRGVASGGARRDGDRDSRLRRRRCFRRSRTTDHPQVIRKDVGGGLSMASTAGQEIRWASGCCSPCSVEAIFLAANAVALAVRRFFVAWITGCRSGRRSGFSPPGSVQISRSISLLRSAGALEGWPVSEHRGARLPTDGDFPQAATPSPRSRARGMTELHFAAYSGDLEELGRRSTPASIRSRTGRLPRLHGAALARPDMAATADRDSRC